MSAKYTATLISELRDAQGDGTDWTEVLFGRAADALESLVDSMSTTIEYAYGSLDAPDIITPTGEDIDDLGSARYNAEEFWLSVLQRTVMRGPWVEVSE